MTSFFFPGPSNHASFQIFIEVSFLTFQPVLRSNNTRAFQILCQVYERSLPDSQAGFFDLIKIYFPMVYDIKHKMKFCNNLHGGLNKLTKLLEVERVDVCHQAGSDSLLTSCTFRKLRDNFFNGSTKKYAGVLYGLGVQNG
ncbi:probable CCR4-associated factor 1 homolog 7 [Gossypium arboreum]|uniref:probable CCR4-associated factor 1 homolog 7 n=1 Tax=Gossypium arboreum TaxID=29729 RepID=UPI0022F150CE|nr:probable CCR4-associated factor 1 homolog 7 [Gossypium arboreum]XP_052880725.1 probable CCR4-associated factor 1 homolog 7 [Gossypium arboreum]XP_052880726.1 probable CCR4-associated factor 1 homolog 7 [Gossypium arboreum]